MLHRPAAGRHETGNPLRQNALDPGFHGVLTGQRIRAVRLMVPMGLVLRSVATRRPTADRRVTEMWFWWC
jgi:hypothetical protein